MLAYSGIVGDSQYKWLLSPAHLTSAQGDFFALFFFHLIPHIPRGLLVLLVFSYNTAPCVALRVPCGQKWWECDPMRRSAMPCVF